MKKVLCFLLVIMLALTTMLSALAEAKAEGDTLTLWIFLNPESNDDARCPVIKKIVDTYNANNKSGHKVVVESMNWDKIETAAIQAAAAGTGPDIINFFSDYLMTHIAAETVQPMTEYAIPFIDQMGDYLHTADNLRVNGDIYGLPWENRVYLYWYRTDIFDTIPKTLDELAEIAATKTDASGLGFTVGLSENSSASTFMESFIPWIHSAGGELLDASGKAVFNDEAGVRVLNTFKKMHDNGCYDRTALSLTLDDVQEGFKAGTLYSISVGSHRSASLNKSSLADKFDTAPIPGFTADEPSPALVAGQTLAIGKYCKNPEAAFDFITYFFSEEIQKDFMAVNTMTIRKSLFDDPDIKALSNYANLSKWNEYASTGSMTLHPEDYAELSVELVRATQQVVYNNADPKAELDRVANWYNEKNGL